MATGSLSRLRTVLVSDGKQYVRSITLVALLVAVPVGFIWLTGVVAPSGRVAVRTTYTGIVATTLYELPNVHILVITQVTVAFLAGMGGLALVQSTAAEDRRLIVCGYGREQLLLARFGLLAVLSVVVSVVSISVLHLSFAPVQPWLFVGATTLVAMLYALVGAIVGTFLTRLSGLYLMLFLPMMDIGVFQNPTFIQGARHWWMVPFPGYFPMKFVLNSGLTESFLVVEPVWWSLAYLFGLAAVIVALQWVR